MFVVMLFSTASMAACGEKETRTPDFGVDLTKVPEGGYDGSAQTIYFWHTMGANLRAELEKAITRFNAIYPNITIKHEQVGSYDDVKNQISTEITEGLQPHLAYCYPDHVAAYNIAGAVQTLDVLINDPTVGFTAEQLADFIPGYYEEGREFGDNLMYTLPFSKSTELLYYDKTFFEAHPELKVPTTWDEMEETIMKIKEIDPKSIPLGYDSESNWFITMCEQQGSPYTSATGEKYLFDNPENKAFVKRFRNWVQSELATTSEIFGDYTSGLFTAVNDETRSYLCIGSSAGASYQCPERLDDGSYPFEVGITSIPQVDPENPKVISQGPSICLFKKTNPQEVLATWEFVKFLTTDVQFQADFSIASGYIPVIKSVEADEVYAEHLASANGNEYITALSAKVALQQADAYYTSPAFNGSSVARVQVGLLMQACFVNSPGADDAAVNALIDEAFADAVTYCKQKAK